MASEHPVSERELAKTIVNQVTQTLLESFKDSTWIDTPSFEAVSKMLLNNSQVILGRPDYYMFVQHDVEHQYWGLDLSENSFSYNKFLLDSEFRVDEQGR